MKTASPLFILRHQCETGLFTILERLKEIGFDGVEFLGFFGHDPESVGRKMKELHLEPVGNHVDYKTFSADPHGVIAAHKAAGCRYITIGGGAGTQSDFAWLSEWIDSVTRIGQMCRNEGITLLFHNHDGELKQRVFGKQLLTHLMDSVPPDALSLEPDVGWMAIAGASPLEYLVRYKDRSPVLHLKDYYTSLPFGTAIPGSVSALGNNRGTTAQGHFEFRPTGYGIMNYPALMKPMLACDPEWIVLDHDLAYERDPFRDLQLSLDYMKALTGIQR